MNDIYIFGHFLQIYTYMYKQNNSCHAQDTISNKNHIYDSIQRKWSQK